MEVQQASYLLLLRTKANATSVRVICHSTIGTLVDVSALKGVDAPLLAHYLVGSRIQYAAALAQWSGNVRTINIGMIRLALANARRLFAQPTKFKIPRLVNARENVYLSGLATQGKFGTSIYVHVSGLISASAATKEIDSFKLLLHSFKL